MSRLRTFIGLDLGKPLRGRIVSLQEKLAQTGCDVKWVEAENIHVTMLFLGEVEDRELMAVCQAVEEGAKAIPAFSLTIEGVGCFPNLRRPRVVWVGVGQGRQEVIALHDAIEKPLLQLGCYRREDRPYTPHITLGRIRSDRPMDKLTAELARQQSWKAGDTTIQEVHVMSSQLTPQGPIYTILSRAKLTGRPDKSSEPRL